MDSHLLHSESPLPRIALVSTHGYVAANPPLGSADTGGQVVYVLELAKKLGQLGFEVDIWTRQFEDQPEGEVVSKQVRILRQPCGGPGFIPKEFLAQHLDEWAKNVLEFAKAHGLTYHFVDSHYWDAGVASKILAQEWKVPHLFTPHSLGIWKKRQMEQDYPGDGTKFEAQYNFAERILREKELVEAADLTIATSPQQWEVLEQDYQCTHGKLVMIPPGYDDNRFYPVGDASREALRRQYGYQGTAVLAVGRLARNKGYDLLVEGFSVMAQRVADARLYLAVGGTNPTSLEETLMAELKMQVLRLNLADRVVFGSFIPDDDLPNHYRAADMFVLSSRYEPFGMTAIEAMACGTPSILTVHGGLYKAISFGRHGLFADPFDKEDLGIMMTKLANHEGLRSRISRMGANRVRSLFTWTGIAQQVVAQIDGVPGVPSDFRDSSWSDPWIPDE